MKKLCQNYLEQESHRPLCTSGRTGQVPLATCAEDYGGGLVHFLPPHNCGCQWADLDGSGSLYCYCRYHYVLLLDLEGSNLFA